MIGLEGLEKYHALEVYFTMKPWGKNCLETISFNFIKTNKQKKSGRDCNKTQNRISALKWLQDSR